jgi:Ca2+-binding EF-hand superfamily protein
MERRHRSEDKEQELNLAFRAFDPEGTGNINIDEFRDALLNLCDLVDEKQSEEICAELDTEGVGSFFYPELVRKIMSLKRLDYGILYY